jgi:hypothetical protein
VRFNTPSSGGVVGKKGTHGWMGGWTDACMQACMHLHVPDASARLPKPHQALELMPSLLGGQALAAVCPLVVEHKLEEDAGYWATPSRQTHHAAHAFSSLTSSLTSSTPSHTHPAPPCRARVPWYFSPPAMPPWCEGFMVFLSSGRYRSEMMTRAYALAAFLKFRDKADSRSNFSDSWVTMEVAGKGQTTGDGGGSRDVQTNPKDKNQPLLHQQTPEGTAVSPRQASGHTNRIWSSEMLSSNSWYLAEKGVTCRGKCGLAACREAGNASRGARIHTAHSRW